MEAPEKIYADPKVFSISDEFNDLLQTKEEGCIEYTRTDALIDNACKFLFENYHGEKLSLRMIENFRRYLKGE